LRVYFFFYIAVCRAVPMTLGNQTQLEDALNGANADWEISRYSGVSHGFTAWSADAVQPPGYVRSWESHDDEEKDNDAGNISV
jgi:gamma-glutamyl:cysteine ligase YbdK (ATP-grasp superfamily)